MTEGVHVVDAGPGARRIRVRPLRMSFPDAAGRGRGPAQKARVKPPLDPANREFTTLLKIDPNEYVNPMRNCHS